MRGDHHALVRRQVECFGGGEIDSRFWLVVAGDLRTENGVPRQIVAPRQIDHQRDVAVRYRRQHVFAFEPRHPGRYVGPGVEPVPRQIELAALLFGERADVEARQDELEIAPMQYVELAERYAAGAHLVHGALVFTAPGVGEGGPIERKT